MPAKDKQLSYRVPTDLHTAVTAFAETQGESLSFAIRLLLKAGLASIAGVSSAPTIPTMAAKHGAAPFKRRRIVKGAKTKASRHAG